MHKICLKKIRGELAKDGVDVFFHILLGAHKEKTELVSSAKKDFVQEMNLSFMAESR